jgi:hypothetical protein
MAEVSIRMKPLRPAILSVFLAVLTFAAVNSVCADQLVIPCVQRMPRLPDPLVVRDWSQVASRYYELLLNPSTSLDGHPLVVVDTLNKQFGMPAFVGGQPDNEAFTCLAAVIGAKLVGLDLTNLNGFDYVQSAKQWYDPKYGIYRHSPSQRGQPVIHSGIYGYWAAAQGLTLAGQYPDDGEFMAQARSTAQTFLRLAKAMGCPDRPDFDVLGFDFDTLQPAGRAEPMNRLGHAPTVAWILLAGAALTDNREMVDCARAAMQWHIDHPGRYEVTHVMGPLTAARLNAEYGCTLDMDRVLAAWFGQGDTKRMPWKITAGMRLGGITCDGLDGAYWGGEEAGFHAFAMGTLQAPAWLVPMVRYDPRYARDVGRYALHAAASARLLQGYGLDWDHQDHKDWKDRWDPQCLLFYEAITSWDWSDRHLYRPYATGDPIRLGWGGPKPKPEEYLSEKKRWFSQTSHNLSLYMGNHIGFLGGIVSLTNIPGILKWDCLATDWHHAPACPTFLFFNPFTVEKRVSVQLGQATCDLYDVVTHRYLKRDVKGETLLHLPPDTARVVVIVPAGVPLMRNGKRLLANGKIVDFDTGNDIDETLFQSIQRDASQ